MEAGFSHIQLAITANHKLNHSTYFTICLNELTINSGHFGPIQGNFTVPFIHNIICRSHNKYKLFTCDWIREKPASTHTTARHTFHHQMIAVHIN